MKETYIYHHLGLGDHIIMNGYVRMLCDYYDRVFLFCKPKNIRNVIKMFRDEKKIKFLAFEDNGVRNYMNIFKHNEYKIIGHTPSFFKKLDDPSNHETFDVLFYKTQNVDPNIKWNNFYYLRNKESEKKAFVKYNLNEDEEYVFIHDSNDRKINRNVPKNIRIIKPNNIEVDIFDHLMIIEKAKEVHVMNSSFMNLIDCIQLRQDGLFYHEYSRPDINTTLKLPWTILK